MPKNPVKAVEDIRTKIAELTAEHRQVSNAAVSAQEVEAAIDAHLAHLSDRYAESRIVDALATQGVLDDLGAGEQPEPFAAFMFGDTIKARLMAAVEPRLTDSLEPGDREQRQRDISKALRKAEIDEENLIQQAEADGLSITRRADANPRVVLGLDSIGDKNA